MDKQRDPAILKRKKRNRIIAAVVVGLSVVALTVAVSRLEPAAPIGRRQRKRPVLRHGQARAVHARGARRRHARPRGNPLDYGDHHRTGRTHRAAARRQSGARDGHPRAVEPGPAAELPKRGARLADGARELANQKATISQCAPDPGSQHRRLRVGVRSGARRLADEPEPGRDGAWCRGFTVRQKQAAVDQAKNRLELARKQLASSHRDARRRSSRRPRPPPTSERPKSTGFAANSTTSASSRP